MMGETMTTMERRVRQEVKTSDAQEVVNAVLSYEQSGEDHYKVSMFGAAHRALENQGYNGWTNYETWCVALWIDNDPGTYEEAREIARTAQQEHEDRTGYGATAAGSLAHALREWMDEQRPEEINGPASVWTDLLGAAFSEVDWYEIAENYLEEVNAE